MNVAARALALLTFVALTACSGEQSHESQSTAPTSSGSSENAPLPDAATTDAPPATTDAGETTAPAHAATARDAAATADAATARDAAAPVDAATTRDAAATHAASESFLACGCGCCGGGLEGIHHPEQCLYHSHGDTLEQVRERDRRSQQSPHCAAAGCSIGTLYHYCD